MPTQLQLLPDTCPAASRDEIQWLVRFLEGRDWTTAKEILHENGLTITEGTKRRIRMIASESGGQVGSGQKGYKLVKQMTAEEYGHNDRWMAHQSAEMNRRRMEMHRVWEATTNPHRVSQIGGANGN